MLSFVFSDINDRDVILPSPVSVRVDVDESAPADSLYAVFPYADTAELKGVKVYSGGKLIFRGGIDEEERLAASYGKQLRISARSPAAYLLDNEAAPCSYDHPSAKLICERYVLPYGITVSDNDDTVYFGEQNIPKGTSCWSVLKSFCTACYSSIPRVSADGVLYLKGMRRDEHLTFGDGQGCVRYSQLVEKFKRCAEISAVWVKTASTGGYTLPIINKDAETRGVRRERYLNAVLTESPMRCADDMIRTGSEKAYTLRLRCPCCLLGKEGCSASVGGICEDPLYISALRYRLSDSGEYTDVILKRRIN